MSVLTDTEIRRLIDEAGLIEPFDPMLIQGASYDLRIGQLMVVEGLPKAVALRRDGHSLEPGAFVLLTTLEKIRMPGDLVGHVGITSSWTRRGIVSLFGPQVDPGFEGILELPLFNAGDASVTLIPGDAMFTVEFMTTAQRASFLWSDKHGIRQPPTHPLPPKASRPNLHDIAVIKRRQEQTLSEFAEHRRDIEASVAGLRTDFANITTQVSVLSARIDTGIIKDQRRWSRRQVVIAIVSIVTAVAVLVVGAWLGSKFSPISRG